MYLYQFDWMGEFYDCIQRPIGAVNFFQWASFMEIAKQITGTYIFLHRWTWNYLNTKYIYEFRATLIFDVFEVKFFQAKSSRLQRWWYTSWQMRSFPELFAREASIDKLIALENFVTFSEKLDWLRPFLLLYWRSRPHFYVKKGGFRR